MKFRLFNRSAFSICGYSMETSLETCGPDLKKLWKDYNLTAQKLYDVVGMREDFYGLMWKTKTSKSNYFYLIGIEVAKLKNCLKKPKSNKYHPPSTQLPPYLHPFPLLMPGRNFIIKYYRTLNISLLLGMFLTLSIIRMEMKKIMSYGHPYKRRSKMWSRK